MKKIIFLFAVLASVSLSAQVNEVVEEIEVEQIADLPNTAVPFNIVENKPTFPGCDSNDKKCFSKKVNDIVIANFNSAVAEGLSGKQKMVVQFTIDTDGTIANIKPKAANEALKNEAARVIQLLPQMIPGTIDGKNVAVTYQLPIAFHIKETRKSSIKLIQPSEIQNN